jgi:folate-binding protein YgfZ
VKTLFERVAGSPAAVRDLSERGLLRVTGADRVRFLNGMLSANVARLGAGQACPALQLDRKGHIQAELWVLAEPDALWLDVAAGAEVELRAVLEKHVIADDVAIESRSEELGQLGIEGPGARAAARGAGAPELEPRRFARADFAGESVLWLAGGSLGAEGLRAFAPRALLPRLREALALPELAPDAAEALRVELALPALGRDLSARNFPQEARLEAAFALDKGCYIGQEIVARIASRGAVNRLLVKLATRALVAPGADIRVGDTVVGQVTSSVLSPASGALALGYVRVAEARAGQAVDVAGVAGEIVGP